VTTTADGRQKKASGLGEEELLGGNFNDVNDHVELFTLKSLNS